MWGKWVYMPVRMRVSQKETDTDTQKDAHTQGQLCAFLHLWPLYFHFSLPADPSSMNITHFEACNSLGFNLVCVHEVDHE